MSNNLQNQRSPDARNPPAQLRLANLKVRFPPLSFLRQLQLELRSPDRKRAIRLHDTFSNQHRGFHLRPILLNQVANLFEANPILSRKLQNNCMPLESNRLDAANPLEPIRKGRIARRAVRTLKL